MAGVSCSSPRPTWKRVKRSQAQNFALTLSHAPNLRLGNSEALSFGTIYIHDICKLCQMRGTCSSGLFFFYHTLWNNQHFLLLKSFCLFFQLWTEVWFRACVCFFVRCELPSKDMHKTCASHIEKRWEVLPEPNFWLSEERSYPRPSGSQAARWPQLGAIGNDLGVGIPLKETTRNLSGSFPHSLGVKPS